MSEMQPTPEQLERAKQLANERSPFPDHDPLVTGLVTAYLSWIGLYIYNGLIEAHGKTAFWAAIIFASMIGLLRGLDLHQKQRRHIKTYLAELENIMERAKWEAERWPKV
jgi:hypothetical protein